MFESRTPKKALDPRAVTIELRDGRKLRGVLQLPRHETAETLLRRATPFLTIRTGQGDIAINRDMISALLLGNDKEAAADIKTAGAAASSPKRPQKVTGFDPCRILQVRPGASRDEIKSAWRKRISECHPDKVRARGSADHVVAAAERQAAQVNAAYQTLLSLRSAA